jgi:hypothetical protein
VLAVALAAALAPGAAAAAVSFATGSSYSSFESDSTRERGSQLLTPVTLSVQGANGFFGGLAGGYAVSTYRPATPGADEVTVRTLLDTQVALFYTGTLGPGCIRVGSGFNLPTGSATLTATERRAEVDAQYSELLPVSSFGEGTNASPGFAYTIPLGAYTVGVGASRHLRGSYDPSADVDGDEVDPGDETLGKLSLEWRGETLKVRGGLRYQHVAPDKVGGVETFAEGDALSGDFAAEYRSGAWFLSFEGAYNTWADSESLAGGSLATEQHRRYGDEVLMKGTAQYLLTRSLLLSVTGRGHFVRANGFPVDSALYDSGRAAVEAAVALWYQAFPGIYLNGGVSCQQVRERADGTLAEDTVYTGTKVSLNLVTWFGGGGK